MKLGQKYVKKLVGFLGDLKKTNDNSKINWPLIKKSPFCQKDRKFPSYLKEPSCASKQIVLELTTVWYVSVSITGTMFVVYFETLISNCKSSQMFPSSLHIYKYLCSSISQPVLFISGSFLLVGVWHIQDFLYRIGKFGTVISNYTN